MTFPHLDWHSLMNQLRRKDAHSDTPAVPEEKNEENYETRSEHERDYDRLLFSAPLRRLQDKTQVFPLERNDSVRTRLTHTHEVANMARSMGVALAFVHDGQMNFPKDIDAKRNIPALLAAIGLAHDLGNPPFGHSGEEAIRAWVRKNADPKSNNASSRAVFGETPNTVAQAEKNDFLYFEGNAQAFRLLTRLQVLTDDYGLNMTYAFLAALLKYPVASDKMDKGFKARKKFNFFQSEVDIVDDVWAQTGLREGVRHPLTYLMEACDDIAYSVVDVEDGVKKGLCSFSKLKDYLIQHSNADPCVTEVIDRSEKKFKEVLLRELSPDAVEDISMQYFRVYAIGAMVPAAVKAFMSNYAAIMDGSYNGELMADSKAVMLWKRLKEFDRTHLYRHPDVLLVESNGFRTIHRLMDYFWDAIIEQETALRDRGLPDPRMAYTFARISENYRRVYESDKNKMPDAYKRLQLVTDMVSGMTDSFALSLYDDLSRCHGS